MSQLLVAFERWIFLNYKRRRFSSEAFLGLEMSLCMMPGGRIGVFFEFTISLYEILRLRTGVLRSICD